MKNKNKSKNNKKKKFLSFSASPRFFLREAAYYKWLGKNERAYHALSRAAYLVGLDVPDRHDVFDGREENDATG